MSSDAPFAIRYRKAIMGSDLSATQRLVAHTLAVFMDAEGQCWPSLQTIANGAGLTRRAVIQAIHSLSGRGYLTREKRNVEGLQEYDRNFYHGAIPQEVVNDVHHVVNDVHQVVKDIHQGGEPRSPGVVNDVHPNSLIELSRELVTEKAPKNGVPISEIVSLLNSKTGKAFKPSTKATASHIKARWAEGFRLDDFKAVIERKADQWATDPKMAPYLRPETLFGSKFEGYLNEAAPAPAATVSLEPPGGWLS